MKSAALFAALAIIALPCVAHAQTQPAAPPEDDPSHAPPSSEPKETSKGPHLVGDVRGLVVIRPNDNYARHASTYHYDLPGTALGIGLTGGVEIVKHISLLASAHYEMNGADRADAHLRIASGAIVGLVRWAFFRSGTDTAFFETAASGGFGRYLIRETYVNTALSPDTFAQSDGAFGGQLGLEAALVVSGFRAMLGYGFAYSPASISDRVGGSVNAGGHEIALGLGIWL
jgi:hypothetical protein